MNLPAPKLIQQGMPAAEQQIWMPSSINTSYKEIVETPELLY
jgi:hypothetical protein